jgi:hypothetical protein
MEHHKPAPKIAIARELAAFLWAALHPTRASGQRHDAPATSSSVMV